MTRGDVAELNEQINRLREGGTLTEKEVERLCEKVGTVGRIPGPRPCCVVRAFVRNA